MNAQQLKNSILQEAIEGRLVPQDPNDEPASVLLDKIRKEKARLVKEGKLKKKDLEEIPISEDEKPFDIPESWEWIRINCLGEVITGGTPSKQNKEYYGDDYPFYKPGDLDKGIDICNSVDRLSQKGYDASRKLKANSILVTCIGATIGKTGLISKEGACNQQINAIIPVNSVFPRYIYYTICAPSLQSILRKDAGQTTLPIMNKNNFCKIQFPLPPLAEQKRIVAKIEEILPKVEEYGKAQETLDKLNEELPERLKKSILQEAIEGRLVPQDPNDEPASVFLDKIRKEKAKLVKEGKLKKKDLEETPISEDEIPYKIPESWEWTRMSNVGKIIMGQSPDGNDVYESEYDDKAFEFHQGKICFTDRYISPSGKCCKNPSRIAEKDSLLLCVRAPIGDVNITQRIISIGRGLAAITGYCGIQTLFLFFWMIAHKRILEDKGTGSTFKAITIEVLKNQLIPLPPLDEQKRIVQKIEQLMNEIDKLKV